MNKVEAYLKVPDVAQYAGLSIKGVRELIEEGEIEALELNGETKIRKTEIDRWLDEEVNLDSLLDLAEKIDGEVDAEKVASTLDIDVDEVEKKLEDKS